MDSSKPYTKDSRRTRHPSETVAMAKERLKLVAPDVFLGIEEIGHLDTLGLPVYRVACNNRYNEWGKGASIEQCQASAIMERVERYSAFASSHGRIPFVRSSFSKLQEEAVSRDAFGLTNLQRIIYQTTSDKVLDWVPAVSLVDKKTKLVPAQCVFSRYPLKGFYDTSCTTGLAAGNTMEEAIHQALCEVMERHQLHVCEYNRPELPRIDLSSIENPALKNVVNMLTDKGFILVANDLSMGWKLSTVSAFLFHPRERTLFAEYLLLGTSSDPEIALLRALTEVAQYRAVQRYRSNMREGIGFFESTSKETQEKLRWLEGSSKMIPIQSVTNTTRPTMQEEIEIAAADIASKGYDILCYDLTHPILKIPVVRILVPGLQPNFLMHRRNHLHKLAAVTEHLNVYEMVLQRCRERQLPNQQLDEFVDL